MNEEKEKRGHPMDMISQMVFEKDFYDLSDSERKKLFNLTDKIRNEVIKKLKEVE